MEEKTESKTLNKDYEREFSLATKGFFYDDKLPDGKIIAEAWDQTTNRKLYNDGVPFNKRLDMLITNCTNINEFGLSNSDLTLVDKQHIFFVVRVLSIGTEHMISFKCSDCGKKAVVEINLDDKLEVIYAESDDDFSIELPICDDTLTWRLLTGNDERLIQKYVNRAKKRGNRESDPAYLYRTALRVNSINGDESIEVTDVMAYLEKLRGKDVMTIQENIVTTDIGIDPEIEVDCNWCHYPNEIMLPMDKNFFRTIEYIRKLLARKTS